jgi:Uma2 family endonuclease
MSTVTTPRLITAEEFALMPDPPDGSLQELVKGVVITMPPPGAPHGRCCMKTGRRLDVFVEEKKLGHVLCNDTGFVTERAPDSVRGADVAFWSFERLPVLPNGYIEIAPDLAVEVVSPTDHFVRLNRKIRQYLERGVRLIWVIDPEDRSVTVYRKGAPDEYLTENDTLSGGDVLPGFTVKVSELFA